MHHFYAPVVGNSAKGSWQSMAKKTDGPKKSECENQGFPTLSAVDVCAAWRRRESQGKAWIILLGSNISNPRHFWVNDTVDGWNPANRLRLVVYSHYLQGKKNKQVVVWISAINSISFSKVGYVFSFPCRVSRGTLKSQSIHLAMPKAINPELAAAGSVGEPEPR